MTISVETPDARFVGNGVTLKFTFNFKVSATADLDVFLIDNTSVSLPAVQQTEGLDYSVSLDDDEGGSATFLITAPTTAQDVLLVRKSPQTQPTDFEAESNFPEENVETSFDKKVLLTQELQEQIDRTVIFDRGSNQSGQIMPEPEASKFLRWKSDKSAFELVSATDILNAVSNDEFWNSTIPFVINNGQATFTDLTNMTVLSASERFALWLFGLKRFTSTEQFVGVGFIPVGLDNDTDWFKGSETYFPIVGSPVHGITFNLTTLSQMQYKSTTLGGTGHTSLLRAKKVILKL